MELLAPYGSILTNFRISYLQVPVYGGYTVFNEADFKIGVLFGGYLGLALDSKANDVDFGASTNSLDFGLSVGLDLQVVQDISLRFTYNYGLLDPYTTTSEYQNRFIQAALVFNFYKL